MRIPVTGTGGAGGGVCDENSCKQVGTVPLERWYSTTNSEQAAGATTRPSVDTIYAEPFVVARAGSIDAMSIYQWSGAAAGNMRLAIYAATGPAALYPSALVVETGDISTAADGYKQVAVAQALTANRLYWLAFNCSRGTDLFYWNNSIKPTLLGISANLVDFYHHVTVASVYGAFPNPFPAGATRQVTATTMPGIWVRWSA